jgi:hypothetical protein
MVKAEDAIITPVTAITPISLFILPPGIASAIQGAEDTRYTYKNQSGSLLPRIKNTKIANGLKLE